jgi:hypothetical protein
MAAAASSTAATVASSENLAPPIDNKPDIDEVTQSLAPSHILQDGRFVYLPPPTNRDKIGFFERSIARHGLLQEDIDRTKKEEEEEKEKKKKEVKVHPLALASARLQSDGVNELNRAINLNTLVATGEYFGLTNIVDPSLAISAAAVSSAEQKSTEEKDKEGAAVVVKPESAMEVEEEQRVKASFVLKRKRVQFEHASETLKRHRRHLAAAVVAQTQPDKRLRQLRPQWRLVAPEHGTRALPHATRPTEVIACDVDVYWKGSAVLGRLAKLVPRYATIELKKEYNMQKDLDKWERTHFPNLDDSMEVEDKESSNSDAAETEEKDTSS